MKEVKVLNDLNLEKKEEKIYKNVIRSTLLDDKLLNVDLEDLEISDLIPTQYYLLPNKLERAERIYDSPILIKNFNNNSYIIDGHHRTYLHYWNDEWNIQSVTLRTKEYEKYSEYSIKFPEFAKNVQII